MKKILLSLSIVFLSINIKSQTTAQARCDAFGKGVNLSNWLEAYWQVGWPTQQGYTKSFLVEIKKSGIKSIRLPINFSNVTDTLAPYHVDTTHAIFDRLDTVIAWAEELDMRLIIDNHHGWALTDTTWRPMLPRISNLWAVLARRYGYLDPEQFSFELLNEPAIGFENDSLRIIFDACIDSIRPYAPNHSIIVSPNFAGIGLGFLDFLPLADTNLIYTFHTYDPYPFTHQGFSWAVPYYAPGTIWPGGTYDFLFPASWDTYESWKNTYQLPVFLGEFGVGSFADEASRCNWMDTVGRRIHKNNLSWFYWDVEYDFQMFNSSVIHKDSIIPCFRQALRLYDDSLSTFSIEDNQKNVDVILFPNPTSDELLCKLDNQELSTLFVIDNGGRLVFTNQFTGQININVSDWNKGMYFLKIHNRNKVIVKKLVVAQ